MELIQPTELTIGEKTYTLGKFPATVGREIITQYPITAMPKTGDYQTNEALMLKVMSYVAVPGPNGLIRLTTKALVDNHVEDATALLRLEWAMLEKNFAFFANGKASGFLQGLAEKVQALILKTLTDFSAQSSAPK